MTTAITQIPSLSYIASGQLPQFARSNYPKFLAFINAYYEWLEQAVAPNVTTVGQLDALGQQFISHFSSDLDTVAKLSMGLPPDKFLGQLHHVFEAKGTPACYQLAFQLLFGDDTTQIQYPSQSVFETSANNWQVQKYAIVNVTNGNPYNAIGSQISFLSGNVTYVCLVNAVTQLEGSYYQIFLDNILNTIPPNATINNSAFGGATVPTIYSTSIASSGAGFKIGQIISSTSNGSSGTTQIYISNVDSNGGVIAYSMLSAEFGVSLSTITFNSATSTLPLVLIPNIAGMSQYPGSWLTNSGFLSDSICLQDGYYYQQFSYVIKSQQQLSEYYQIAKQYLHPAGRQLFATFSQQSNVTLVASLQILMGALNTTLNDYVVSSESFDFYLQKGITDTISIADIFGFDMAKLFGSPHNAVLNSPTFSISNGQFNSVLSYSPQTNYALQTSFSSASSGTPGTLPTGYSISSDASVTVSGQSITTVSSLINAPYMVLTLTATVTGGGGKVYINVPNSMSGAASGTYTASGIIGLAFGTLPQISCGYGIANNGSTWTVSQTNFTSVYAPVAVTGTLVNMSSVSLFGYVSFSSPGTYTVSIVLGAIQLQNGAQRTWFIPTTTASVTRTDINWSGSSIVFSAAPQAFQTITYSASGYNSVTLETFNTTNSYLGTTNGVTTSFSIPTPNVCGTSNTISITLNPYNNSDYFIAYADGISNYVNTQYVSTQ